MADIISITPAQTMSSLQIAELTGKRHDAILRDIRNLLEQGVAAHNFVETSYTDKSNRQSPCYQLTKTGCLILASGYSAILREKIINRWMELEMMLVPQAPKTFAEALRLAADKVEENERLLGEIEEQQKLLVAQSEQIRDLNAMRKFFGAVVVLYKMNYICGMKRIYKWFSDMLIKHKIRKARRFMERNCIERIRQGQTSCAGECAADDWASIQYSLYETYINTKSSSPSVSSEH